MSNFNFKPSSFSMTTILSARSSRAVVGHTCPVKIEGDIEAFIVTESEADLKKLIRGLLGHDYPFSSETMRKVVIMPDDDAVIESS